MELFRNLFIAGVAVISCIVFYLANTGSVFGRLLNKFFPCQQDPSSSFPCFGQYDIAIMIAAGIVGSVFFVILIFDIYKS